MLNELIIPASELLVVKQYDGNSDQLGHRLKNQLRDTDIPPHVALLGIPEARGSACRSVAMGADEIRRQLYTLSTFPPEIDIADLGNIRAGNDIKDTYAAVKMVAEELSTRGVRVIILGGSQEFTVPLLLGLNRETADLVIVDDRVDNSVNADTPPDEYYINNLPLGTTVTVIAGQSYFIGNQVQDLLAEGVNGEVVTLGEIRSDFKELEPMLRKCDLVSFDFGSLKRADGPGQYRISPNGLAGEEACQISWYTGLSTSPSWFGLFGYSPADDPSSSGAMMAAQICWYFINGLFKRIDGEPEDEATEFDHFPVTVEGLEDPISFLVHPISKRWWMEVPSEDCTLFPVRIPCSKKDYRKACNNEISEKWWKYFNKI